MYYLDVVDVLQTSEDQARSSMLCLLSGWALKAVSDLPVRFWLSESGEVVLLLGQHFDVIKKRISQSGEDKCGRTDSIRSRGRSVLEDKAESENGKAEEDKRLLKR